MYLLCYTFYHCDGIYSFYLEEKKFAVKQQQPRTSHVYCLLIASFSRELDLISCSFVQ